MVPLIFLCMLLSMPAIGKAVDYYVSPTGSGTACTSGNPCSVATGQGNAGNGDTLIFKDGTYNLASGLRTQAAGVTYRAQNRHLAIIRNSGSGSVVDVDHSTTTLDGLHIDGGQGTWDRVGVEVGRDSPGNISNFVLKNSIVENTGQPLVKIGVHVDVAGFTITHNVIRDSGNTGNGEAFYISDAHNTIGVTNGEIAYNVISDFTQGAVDLKAGASNIRFHHNDFFGATYKDIGCAVGASGCKDTMELAFISREANNIFEQNVFRDCNNAIAANRRGNQVVVLPSGGGNNKFRNNVVSNCDNYDQDLIGSSNTKTGTLSEVTGNTFCDLIDTTIEGGINLNIHDNPAGSTPLAELAQSACDSAETLLRTFPLTSGTVLADGITSRWVWNLASLFPLGNCSAVASAFSCTGSTTGAQTGQSCTVQGTETSVAFTAPFVQGETITCSVAQGTLADTVPAGSWQFENRVVAGVAFTNNASQGGLTAPNLLKITNHIADSNNFATSPARPWENLYDTLKTDEGSAGNTGITSFFVEHDLGASTALKNFEITGDADGSWLCGDGTDDGVTFAHKLLAGDAYTTAFTNQNCRTNDTLVYAINQTARYVHITVTCAGCAGTQAREFFLSESPQTQPSPGMRKLLVRQAGGKMARMGAAP